MAKDKYKEYEGVLPGSVLSLVKKEVEKSKLNDAQIKDLLNRTKEAYDKSLIAPGEDIGIVTAESFGEPGTQMVLRTFHLAGVSEMQVTEGLPRLIEIFDARETPNKPIINVYLKKEYTKDEKTIRKVASKIKEIQLESVASQFSLNLMKATVEVNLDSKRLTDYGLKASEILSALESSMKGVGVKLSGKKIILTPKEGETSLVEVYKLKEKAKSVIVRGIKGITQVLPMKKNNELVVLCAGTNFKGVLELDEVDDKRTFTNDIHDTAKVLGIEAARQAIINESLSVVQSQGLDIDIRHTLFLADLMTSNGKVQGITRGGITGAKESVLARATFETPIPHLVNASLIGEKDNLNSVIENVIINQPIPLGTGLPGLIAKKGKK